MKRSIIAKLVSSTVVLFIAIGITYSGRYETSHIEIGESYAGPFVSKMSIPMGKASQEMESFLKSYNYEESPSQTQPSAKATIEATVASLPSESVSAAQGTTSSEASSSVPSTSLAETTTTSEPSSENDSTTTETSVKETDSVSEEASESGENDDSSSESSTTEPESSKETTSEKTTSEKKTSETSASSSKSTTKDAETQKATTQKTTTKKATTSTTTSTTAKPTTTTTKKVTTTKAPTSRITTTKAPTTTAPRTQGSSSSYVNEVVRLVNNERARVGLQPLNSNNSALHAAAQKRATETYQYFSHTRPTGARFYTVLTEYGVSFGGAGENIAAGQPNPASVVSSWMNSAGHRENILKSSYTYIGIGVYTAPNGTIYWSQLFIS